MLYRWWVVRAAAAVILVPLLLIVGSRTIGGNGGDDLLIYSINHYPLDATTTALYDTGTGESTPILADIEFDLFRFSSSGHLAYTVGGEVYVLDILTAESSPIHIDATNDVLEWSINGRYLLFNGLDTAGNQRIIVWDRETASSIDITPTDFENITDTFGTSWSADGRLAFNIWHQGQTTTDGDSEIYLWNGETTINLSQNPTSGDGSPIWSSDGQLAFLSYRDSNDNNQSPDILVWDGLSYINGVPDVSTFSKLSLPAEFERPIGMPSSLAWTTDGQLTFNAINRQESNHVQIYLWDGQTATNISQTPNAHSGFQSWTQDGRWTFTHFFSSPQSVYIRDRENRTLLETEGRSPVWSPNGSLMFCNYNGDWILSIWDGQEVIEVATVDAGGTISAQWQNGDGVYCSSG